MIQLDKIYNENCLETMNRMEDNSIDLVVTSPPYDDLRTYKGYQFPFEKIAENLARVIKSGCCIVWVVGDSVINGSETGNSFKQALYFINLGLKLHDTMIYEKNSSSFPASFNSKRYTQIFEYMFVFCKDKIRNDISLLKDKPNKWAGFTNWGQNTFYDKEGNKKKTNNIKPIPEYSLRNNIWKYNVGFNDKTGHPAVFPEQLAQDHILSWSKQQEVVYDPFMGSGTVAKMAIVNQRHFIGSEISKEYCDIIKNRIKNVQVNLF